MIKKYFLNFSTRIRSGVATAAQEASQEMGATRRDVSHAGGFRGPVAGTSVRTEVTSQSGAPGPAFRATQSLE